MAKRYVPKEVKETGSTDVHGNMGYSIVFENGERAFMLAKRAPEIGIEEWGEITQEPKRDKPDETYAKFKRVKKEEYVESKGYDNEGAAWGNALTNAVTITQEGLSVEKVIETAKKLFDARNSKDAPF